jgi:hypothetical protein
MSDRLTVDHGTPRPRILIAPNAGVRMCPLSLVSIGVLPDHDPERELVVLDGLDLRKWTHLMI